MSKTSYETPADLGPAGVAQWEAVVERMGDRLQPVDLPLLKMTCQWIDRFNRLVDSSDKGVDIKLGIACDKLLLLSAKFGLTPHDRKGQADDKPANKRERRRTAVDSLNPKELGLRVARTG